MKQHVIELLHSALRQLQDAGALPTDLPDLKLDRSRDKQHGDYACNIAMAAAKAARQNPRAIAERIVQALPASPHVARVEIAGPGFINFHMSDAALRSVIPDILDQGAQFGRSDLGQGRRIQVEFVSANPTGPLHVGHGRGAAYGATVAALLAAVGYRVHSEYYVNDAGRQMDILATSIWLRYLELCGEELVFPVNGYRGDYVWDIAATLHRDQGEALRRPAAEVFQGVPADQGAAPDGDKEAHIDGLIERARALLGTAYPSVHALGVQTILDDIRRDLQEFGVEYDEWYSERRLMDSGAVQEAIEGLRQKGDVYEKDGGLWFRATAYGDEKDRVLVRQNGQTTYFASDVAYHADKFKRGFEHVIDIWGADHHGYVPRVKAALQALGDYDQHLEVLLVQFAVLYRGGEKVQMSTRSGEFVTLRELRREVGNDAARLFYVMRKCEQHLDFDLDLAKSRSEDNPVWYIQYAHARVCNVLKKLAERELQWDAANGNAKLALLQEPQEIDLLTSLSKYPEVLESAATNHEPHQLVYYLRELAKCFHTCYNEHRILDQAADLRDARLSLAAATRQVIYNGLRLLGVSAPESM